MNNVLLQGECKVPDNCVSLIDSLIAIRHEKGMTQKDLASATNLTQSVIARFESKKIVPQLDTIDKIASALGCKITISR